MKKITNKTLQLRKLVVRRETITSLTTRELHNVAGGGNNGSFWPCEILSFNDPCNDVVK